MNGETLLFDIRREQRYVRELAAITGEETGPESFNDQLDQIVEFAVRHRRQAIGFELIHGSGIFEWRTDERALPFLDVFIVVFHVDNAAERVTVISIRRADPRIDGEESESGS